MDRTPLDALRETTASGASLEGRPDDLDALPPGPRIVVRSGTADATQEVANEDILFEGEALPPVSSVKRTEALRITPVLAPPGRTDEPDYAGAFESFQFSSLREIKDTADVEEFAEFDPETKPLVLGTSGVIAVHSARQAQEESPSVAPVSFRADGAASVPAPPLPPEKEFAFRKRSRSFGLGFLFAAVFVAAAAVGYFARDDGALAARFVTKAHPWQLPAVGTRAAPEATALGGRGTASAPAEPAARVDRMDGTPGAAKNAVSVADLPKVDIAADGTRVTFPASATGHRIFVDGTALVFPQVDELPPPTIVACGRHVLRIGSGGADRTVDLPCGAEFTLH